MTRLKQKIKTFLWFDGKAEEAAQHYVSIFGDSKILHVGRGEDGTAFTVEFQLEGQEFIALNGGPHFKFNEAISLFVECDSQDEVDALWSKLLADGGREDQCGWLKDKFGLSWQIVPSVFLQLMKSGNHEASGRVFAAMLKMKKFDIATLERAYRNEG